eukprot:jgi/Bigna1/136355/aug1.33_g11063
MFILTILGLAVCHVHGYMFASGSQHSKCQKYCSKALSVCPGETLEFRNFTQCMSQCSVALKATNATGWSAIYEDSIECRTYHLDLAHQTGALRTHCRFARIDANVISGSSSSRTYAQCVAGNRTNTTDGANFLLLLAKHKTGVNGSLFDSSTQNSLDVFAESLSSGRHGGCDAIVQYNRIGSYCDIVSSSYLSSVFGNQGVGANEALGYAPKLCKLNESFATCPEVGHRSTTIANVAIDECWNALESAEVCQLEDGMSNRASCCAAIMHLDSLGCFCDSVLYSMSKINPHGLILNLRAIALPTCVPLSSQYNQTSSGGGCPTFPEYDSQEAVLACTASAGTPYNRSQLNVILGDRVNTIMQLERILDSHTNAPSATTNSSSSSFDYELLVEDISPYVNAEAVLHVTEAGSYVGVEGFVTYFSQFMPAANNALWERSTIRLYDWTVRNSSRIGVRVLEEHVLFGGDLTRTIEKVQEFEFQHCSSMIWRVVESYPNNELVSLFQRAVSHPRYGPDAYCKSIFDYCIGDLQEFATVDGCISYQNSLPKAQCGKGHLLQGSISPCKLRHALAIPFRPDHHCPHAGFGNKTDRDGNRFCASSECYTTATKLQLMPENSTAAFTKFSSSETCTLTEKSPLLIKVSVAAASPCTPFAPAVAELALRPITNESSLYLQSFCRPAWNTGERENYDNRLNQCDLNAFFPASSSFHNRACSRIRRGVRFESLKFSYLCGRYPRRGSTLGSVGALLQAASRISAFEDLVCSAVEGTAATHVCEACSMSDINSIVAWADLANNDTEMFVEDNTPVYSSAAPSRFCAEILHYACSNAYGSSSSSISSSVVGVVLVVMGVLGCLCKRLLL